MSKFTGTKEELEFYIIKKWMRLADVAKIYGVANSCIGYWVKKFGIKVLPCGGRNIKDLTGQKFGRLLVIKKVKNIQGRGEANWLCKCDCGKMAEVIGASLRHGLTKSCDCLRREKIYRGYKLLSGTYWHRIQKGAKKRNLKIDITLKDAWAKFEEQQGRCALSGVPIGLVTDYTRKHKEHTASLDRIDNKKGYIKDNIQWVHRKINYMKNKYLQDEFIEWCRKVARHADTKTRKKTINSSS